MKDWTFYLPIPHDLLEKVNQRVATSGLTLQAELLAAIRRGIDCQRGESPMVEQPERTEP